MPSPEISEYYDSTANQAIRDDLVFAVEKAGPGGVAVDCGCGAGSNIAFLREHSYTVHAFDIEPEAITRCAERFQGDSDVRLSVDSFSSFEYPQASLVVADASLFFCPQDQFDGVWKSIVGALSMGGTFCGSFLGPEDTMAGPDYDREAYWGEVLVFGESEVRAIFSEFEILKWTEHKLSREVSPGNIHHWHVYSLVASKR